MLNKWRKPQPCIYLKVYRKSRHNNNSLLCVSPKTHTHVTPTQNPIGNRSIVQHKPIKYPRYPRMVLGSHRSHPLYGIGFLMNYTRLHYTTAHHSTPHYSTLLLFLLSPGWQACRRWSCSGHPPRHCWPCRSHPPPGTHPPSPSHRWFPT